VTVIGLTWSTAALAQTIFYIYGAAADTVVLSPQTETGFNSATYTHELNFILSTTYTDNPACNTLGDDTCYTSATNVVNLSDFLAVLTDLSAITFTVNAAIIERNYLVATYRVVHRIKKGISFVETTPNWSAVLSQTAFFIYAAAAVTVTLPTQTET
jgi:hypothetical protein